VSNAAIANHRKSHLSLQVFLDAVSYSSNAILLLSLMQNLFAMSCLPLLGSGFRDWYYAENA